MRGGDSQFEIIARRGKTLAQSAQPSPSRQQPEHQAVPVDATSDRTVSPGPGSTVAPNLPHCRAVTHRLIAGRTSPCPSDIRPCMRARTSFPSPVRLPSRPRPCARFPRLSGFSALSAIAGPAEGAPGGRSSRPGRQLLASHTFLHEHSIGAARWASVRKPPGADKMDQRAEIRAERHARCRRNTNPIPPSAWPTAPGRPSASRRRRSGVRSTCATATRR